MRENPGALDKLYTMLNDAESLGLSRPARMRLIGIIGSLENEELDRFKSRFRSDREDGGSRRGDREDVGPARSDSGERWDEPRPWGERALGHSRY